MDHTVILQYIQALGFPVCASIALGWALWRVGSRLLESHFILVEENRINAKAIVEELKEQSAILANWPSDPVKTICQIDKITSELKDNCGAHEIAAVLKKQGKAI